jgi:hypothetical protein
LIGEGKQKACVTSAIIRAWAKDVLETFVTVACLAFPQPTRQSEFCFFYLVLPFSISSHLPIDCELVNVRASSKLDRTGGRIWLVCTSKEILAEVSEAAKQNKILDAYQKNVLAKQGKARELPYQIKKGEGTSENKT